ncbi:MAG: hypothetical protein J6X28_06290 [Bacilli bacterium]|nr:hypothetical protein [Bacilli bacterium]
MNIVSSCTDYAMVGVLSVVRRILSLFQIIAPILCIISLAITFIHLMRDPDNKKLLKKIRNSIISLFVVFFIPTIVNATFSILDDSTPISSCWQLANYTYSAGTYVPVDDRERTSFLDDPGSYASGSNQKKGIKELVYYNQHSYADVALCGGSNNVSNAGCGIASFAMIASTYVNPAYEPRMVAGWFCQFKRRLTDGGLNEDAVSAMDTLAYFGLKGEVLYDKTDQSGLNYGTSYNSKEGNAILQSVNAGKSVMFGMPGHWGVAGPHESCNNTQVYLYNPARPTSNGCYTPEELFSYTYNYGNRCYNTGWCGWDVAIALYT